MQLRSSAKFMSSNLLAHHETWQEASHQEAAYEVLFLLPFYLKNYQ